MKKHWLTIVILILLACAAMAQDKQLTQERRIIAMTILGEARGEGEAGMYAVGCIIAQRSISGQDTYTHTGMLEEMAILLLESKRSQQSKAAKPTEYTTGSVCKASCCKLKTVTKEATQTTQTIIVLFQVIPSGATRQWQRTERRSRHLSNL